MEKLTSSEMMFAIGLCPTLNASEKYTLFLELVCHHYPFFIYKDVYCDEVPKKKLSSEKKASFESFLTTINIEDEKLRYYRNGVEWLPIVSKKYPEALRQIYAPPVGLFYRGNVELLNNHTWLGVVGSRDYSSYGTKVIEQIIPPLLTRSKHEIGIVSGLAKGIDTEAHMATIKHGGSTVGVIGTGLDRAYPQKNKMLQEYMGKNQLVISEYPLTSKPLKYHFPERNRIIAGLSRGILVVEAKKSSGSLITAYNALEENRDVFAVPGSIFESNREGNHRLLQLGAILTQSSDDILKEWFYI